MHEFHTFFYPSGWHEAWKDGSLGAGIQFFMMFHWPDRRFNMERFFDDETRDTSL